jgi:hypothetical protein
MPAGFRHAQRAPGNSIARRAQGDPSSHTPRGRPSEQNASSMAIATHAAQPCPGGPRR